MFLQCRCIDHKVLSQYFAVIFYSNISSRRDLDKNQGVYGDKSKILLNDKWCNKCPPYVQHLIIIEYHLHFNIVAKLKLFNCYQLYCSYEHKTFTGSDLWIENPESDEVNFHLQIRKTRKLSCYHPGGKSSASRKPQVNHEGDADEAVGV